MLLGRLYPKELARFRARGASGEATASVVTNRVDVPTESGIIRGNPCLIAGPNNLSTARSAIESQLAIY